MNTLHRTILCAWILWKLVPSGILSGEIVMGKNGEMVASTIQKWQYQGAYDNKLECWALEEEHRDTMLCLPVGITPQQAGR